MGTDKLSFPKTKFQFTIGLSQSTKLIKVLATRNITDVSYSTHSIDHFELLENSELPSNFWISLSVGSDLSNAADISSFLEL